MQLQEFLLILFNKDIEVRKINSEMIFQTCIGDYLDKNNNSDITGVTEPGSSGSPLFGANKLVVGTLTGGSLMNDLN